MFNTIKRKFVVLATSNNIREEIPFCYEETINTDFVVRRWFPNKGYESGDKVTEYYKKNNLTQPYKIIIKRKIS